MVDYPLGCSKLALTAEFTWVQSQVIWIAAYLLCGAIVYFWMVVKYSDDPDDFLVPFLMLLEPGMWLLWLLWPITIWKCKTDFQNQTEKMRKRKEVKIRPTDPMVGKLGETLTSMKPSGRIQIGETPYEAISVDGMMERKEGVEVVGRTMGMLRVRKLRQ